ncbi:Hypothetical_protein [Hexamita inflata]|uniref:Hypothetical_protein n=1 Tax=Hexamita inflata TaxID=28002 RepID=A0AA86UTQ8_9EUKA|nr:Hypothetical protein HINF_LOCUS34319 [Hexamita inflata]CAI9971335.1 Hypothetical protein HINF_LOCUS58980 [Hexamita inflata]
MIPQYKLSTYMTDMKQKQAQEFKEMQERKKKEVERQQELQRKRNQEFNQIMAERSRVIGGQIKMDQLNYVCERKEKRKQATRKANNDYEQLIQQRHAYNQEQKEQLKQIQINLSNKSEEDRFQKYEFRRSMGTPDRMYGVNTSLIEKRKKGYQEMMQSSLQNQSALLKDFQEEGLLWSPSQL